MAGGTPRAVLKGSLDFVCLPELLRFLGANGSTGILRIRRSPGREVGLVGFSGGCLLNATCGEENGVDALMAVIRWREGEYEFFEKDMAPRPVIRESLDDVVARGLSLLRAENAGVAGGGSGDRAADQPNVFLIKGPVVNYSYVVDEQEFGDGRVIVEQGSRGSWVSVLLEGYADVIRETAKGPFKICRIGPGALIGDLTIVMNRENIRGATVVAVGEVVLGLMDLKAVYNEFSTTSADLRSLFLSLNRRWGQVNQCLVEAWMGGKALRRLGERTLEFDAAAPHVIRSGSAAVLKQTKQGELPVAVLSEGDFVGDVPFMRVGHEPHHATVRTTKNFEAEPLGLDTLAREYAEAGPMVKNITEYVVGCVSATTRILRDLHRRNGPADRN